VNAKRLADRVATALFVASLLVSLVFAAIPLVVSVALSVDPRDYISRFPPPGVSFRWYVAFFTNPYYLEGLKTSLVVAVVATAAATAAGVLAAVFLDRYRFRGRDLLQTAFLSPLIIPSVVMGFGMLVFASAAGLFEGLHRLILGHVIICIPYAIRATLASLVGIRPSLVEAAMSLGANERQAFLDIVFPLAKTGVAAGAIFAFVLSFDEVAVSLFLSDPFSYTLPVAILAEMRANLSPTIAAISVVFMAFTVLLIYALDRLVDLDRLIGQGIYRA
jgi:putative spermidine/putrescine transport system permease protein